MASETRLKRRKSRFKSLGMAYALPACQEGLQGRCRRWRRGADVLGAGGHPEGAEMLGAIDRQRCRLAARAAPLAMRETLAAARRRLLRMHGAARERPQAFFRNTDLSMKLPCSVLQSTS